MSASSRPQLFSSSRLLPLAALLLAVAASPSYALYKVVGPDGKVTYTDRPPTSAEGRAAPIAGQSTPNAQPANSPALPAELQQAVRRYPVTLYTSSGACEPCESARKLLRQRGVPYSERQVISTADSEALKSLTGGNDVPVLTIGSQILRGLASDSWNGYLDSAGYPRESRLPNGYQYPAAAPITERREAAPPSPASAPSPAAAPAPAPAPSNPAGIRF